MKVNRRPKPVEGPKVAPGILLRIENLSVKIMGSQRIGNWSFDIKTGDIIAVIGNNGSGKTTLLKIMAGLTKNYNGTITRSPGTKMAYMPQIAEFSKSVPITVREFITLWAEDGVKNTYNSECVRLLKVSPIMEESIDSLSGGEVQKVLFCSAIQSGANLILLDEPENHLDDESVEIIMQIMSKSKDKAFVVVSHEHQKIVQKSNHTLQIGKSIVCRQHSSCNEE